MGLSSIPVYVGTYTSTGSRGIYLFRLNQETGALHLESATPSTQPSYLAVHPTGRWLYAVNETSEFEGRPGGSVSAYRVDPDSGRLSPLNRQPSQGAHPCHLSLDATGSWLLVANYNGGSVAMLPIRADGSLGPPTDLIQHQGSGLDPRRQAAPHAHAALPDPANRHLLVVDLGLDRVIPYHLDLAQGRLWSKRADALAAPPGAGPRALAWHPNDQFAYVLNELDSTLLACRYEPDHGRLTAVQTVTTLPPDCQVASHAAEVQVHPSGRFVYASNRGHDSIAVYRIDGVTGHLTHVSHHPTLGSTPRHFSLDPSGQFLVVANQRSNSLVTFRVSAATGQLEPCNQVAEVPAPTCVRFLPLHLTG